MTVDPIHSSEEDDLLAAEFALGLSTGDDLAEAQRRLASDPAFAQAVVAWEARLANLTDDLPSDQPSAAAKQALMARVFPEPAPVLASAPFWQGARIWQAISAACVLALLVVGLNLFTPAPDTPGPLFTAEIVAEAGDFRVVAVVDRSNNEVILTRTLGAAPEGRILQVWAHGPDAPAISVGLWPEGESIRLPLPSQIAAVTGVLTVGVSEEPIGGSPTGSPSGRVYGTTDFPAVTGT